MVSRLLADIDYVEEASRELSRRIEEVRVAFAAAFERLITIPGVQPRTAEVMVAEIGPDMSRFPSAAHLSSWAGAAGRQVLEIAYHLLAQPTTCRKLSTDYFDRYHAERLKRRSLGQLRRLGHQATLTQLPTAA